MVNLFSKRKIPISVVFLVLVNLIPLFEVLFFNWDVFSLLFLYWLETTIVAFYFILKIWKIIGFLEEENKEFKEIKEKNPDSYPVVKIIYICIPIFAYGSVISFHLLLLFGIFKGQSITFNELIFPFLFLFISHGISYFKNFIRNKEFLKTDFKKQLFQLYRRVYFIQIILFLESFLAMIFGYPVFVLAIMVLSKIVLDVKAHVKEHSFNLKN